MKKHVLGLMLLAVLAPLALLAQPTIVLVDQAKFPGAGVSNNAFPMNTVNSSYGTMWTPTQLNNLQGDVVEFGWQWQGAPISRTYTNVKYWFGETTTTSSTLTLGPTYASYFNAPTTPVLAYDGPMTINTTTALQWVRNTMQNIYYYTGNNNLYIHVEVTGGSGASSQLQVFSGGAIANFRLFNGSAVTPAPTGLTTSFGNAASFGILQQINGEHTEMKEVSVDQPGNRPIIGNNTVKARIRNNGTLDKSTHPIPMEYRVNNGPWVSETFPPAPFAGLAQRTVSFTQPWVVTQGGTYSVEVRLNPAIGQGLATLTQAWQVYDIPNIVPQFTDNFNFTTALDQYTVIKGSLADAQIKAAAAMGTGTGVRLMSTQSTGTFTPVDLSNAAHRAVIDTPSLWDGGGVVDPSAFVGSMVLETFASGVQNLNVSFAYRIVQTGTTPAGFADRQANMIFQWSLDNSTWNLAAGPTANTSGIYRTAATSSTPPAHTVETLSITGLPGTANQKLWFRFRWLCRLKDDTASVQTYVDIDNFQLTVPFTINTLALPSATATVPYEYEHGTVNVTQISGSAPVSFSVTPPPAWMTLNASTGRITGMPPASAAGTTNLTFNATDSTSAVATRVIPFTVKPAPSAVAITNLPTLPDASEGVGYDYNLSAFGGAPIQFGTTNPRYFWSITTDASSSWLSVETNTGRLTGTPPAGSFGSTARIVASVKDGLADLPAGTAANRTTKEFFIHIVEQLAVVGTNLELAREGNSYRPTMTAVGGSAPYTWEIASGSLPAGLTFLPESGMIVGVPLLGQTGTYPLVIEVRDAGVQSVQFNTTLVVAAAITSSNLHIPTDALIPGAATETQPYEAWLDAVEGVPPYTWQVALASPDTLPPGLSINNQGRISGIPFSGTARPYTITFEVTDSAPTPQVHSQTLSLEVLGLISPPSIVTSLLQTAEVGQAYPPPIPFPPVNINAPGLRVSGGSAPFVWELISGTLPQGMTFSSIGLISGVPLKDAELLSPYNLTVRVTDALNNSHERALILDVLPFSGAVLSVIATTPPASTEGSPYSFRLTASGGANPTGSTLPYVFRRVTGTLPTGMDMDPFGQIRGTPIAGTAGSYDILVEARDSAGFTAQTNISLNVIAGAGGGGGGGPAADPVSFAGSGSGCSVGDSRGNAGMALLFGLLAMMGLSALRRRRA